MTGEARKGSADFVFHTCGSVASGWDAAKIINNAESHHLGLICQLNQTEMTATPSSPRPGESAGVFSVQLDGKGRYRQCARTKRI